MAWTWNAKNRAFLWRKLNKQTVKFETIEDDIGQRRSPSSVRTRPDSSALALASWHSPALPALSFQKLPHEWTQVLSLVAFKTLLLWPQSYFVYLSFQSYIKIIYSMVLYFFGGVKYNNGGKIRFGNDIETRSFTFETLQPLSLYGNHDCNQFCVLRYVSKM